MEYIKMMRKLIGHSPLMVCACGCLIFNEKGLKLSTGQKRRINILRSYLLDKDIYILDEPTSNLDKHTEDVVVNFILKYFQNKILVIVTHNEKINRVCNKFYQFENHVLKKIDK